MFETFKLALPPAIVNPAEGVAVKVRLLIVPSMSVSALIWSRVALVVEARTELSVISLLSSDSSLKLSDS